MAATALDTSMFKFLAPWRAVLLFSVLLAVPVSICSAQEQNLELTSEGAGRSLQQSSSSSSSDPKEVATAKDLLAAVEGGAKHIRVKEHMDLTGLPGPSILNQDSIDKWKLRSIRGDCEDPVPSSLDATSLLKLKPRQCLLLLDQPLSHLTADGLWLDNLYLRAGDTLDFALMSHFRLPSDLYLTSCTFQGAPGTASTSGGMAGLLAKNTFAEGCDFVDLVTATLRPVIMEPFEEVAPLASFKDCTFTNPPTAEGEAPTIIVRAGGSLRLENCKLETDGTGTATIETDSAGQVYSDDLTLEVTAGAGRRLLQAVQSLGDVPATITFLSGNDDFIADARESNPDPEVEEPAETPEEVAPEPEEEEQTSPDTPAETPRELPEDKDPAIGNYIGYAAAAIAVGLLIFGACYCIRNCKQDRSNTADGPGPEDLANYYGGTQGLTGNPIPDGQDPTNPSGPYQAPGGYHAAAAYQHPPPQRHPEVSGGVYVPDSGHLSQHKE